MTDKVQPTLVTFLLDRSSSMGAIWDDTIDGFNAYLVSLQKEGAGAIKFTRLQFDHQHGCEIQRDCVAEPIASVKPLDKRTYQPRGSTPLIEAAHKTIQAIDASLSKFDVKHNVIVCIQTDGQENTSNPEYTWDGLKALIEAKTKDGWVFNFMGTGIDAYEQGGRMGIAAQNTMSTGTSREHVTAAYASVGASNMRFAGSGLMAEAAYTAAERHLSGEHTVMGKPSLRPAPQPIHTPFVAPTAPLDLGPNSPPTMSLDGLDLTP
jgi:hypothetical protein